MKCLVQRRFVLSLSDYMFSTLLRLGCSYGYGAPLVRSLLLLSVAWRPQVLFASRLLAALCVSKLFRLLTVTDDLNMGPEGADWGARSRLLIDCICLGIYHWGLTWIDCTCLGIVVHAVHDLPVLYWIIICVTICYCLLRQASTDVRFWALLSCNQPCWIAWVAVDAL